MAEEIGPYRFIPHASDLGHTLVFGPIATGKTINAELAQQRAAGQPGGSNSIAQADDIEAN